MVGNLNRDAMQLSLDEYRRWPGSNILIVDVQAALRACKERIRERNRI